MSGGTCCGGAPTFSLLVLALLLCGGRSLDVRHKPASQGSSTPTGPASKAVDGDIDTFNHNDFDDPRNKVDPWLKVDLGALYCIQKITIVNRMDRDDIAGRLAGAVVRAGLDSNHSRNAQEGSPITSSQVNNRLKVIDFKLREQPVTARYVSVDNPGVDKFVHLGEVIVEEFIDESGLASKVIPLNGALSTQSSTLGANWAASNAIEESFLTDDAYCSQTTKQTDPWWKVDLQSEHCVRKIILKSRDAAYISGRERFEGAIVRAGTSNEITGNMQCGSTVTKYQAVANNWMEFACNSPDGVVARYVSVNIQGKSKQLPLCKVLVIPCDLPEEDYCVVADPALVSPAQPALMSVYRGPQEISADVSFGRQPSGTGAAESGLPPGAVESVGPSSDDCQPRKLLFPVAAGTSRTGVFYFEAVTFDRPIRIQTVALPVDGTDVQVRPLRRTQVASVGDSVTLEMRGINSPRYRWKYNGNDVITSWKDQASVSIANVSAADAGIYTCFVEGSESPENIGITRLIVRGCPANKWHAPTCSRACPRCYNGGVCNERTGRCVCAPRFSGKHCQQVHGRNVFGQTADQRCSASAGDHGDACQGRLFCLPDPYGCSCAAGYQGLDCSEECNEGKYGADCRQTCHCALGATCEKDTGECSDDDCETSHFGVNCQCPEEEAYPFGVTSTSVAQRTANFSWSRPACGSSIRDYTYQLTDVQSGAVFLASNSSGTSETLQGLVPYTEYSFHVAANTNFGRWPFSEGTTVQTKEAEPTAPLDVVVVTVDEDSITVRWAKPSPPQGIIINYDIAYWNIGDGTSRLKLIDVGMAALSHRIPGLQLNVTYVIEVRAKTAVGVGPWSKNVTEIVVGVPGPVRNLRSTSRTDESLTLVWGLPVNINGPVPTFVVEFKATDKPHQPDFSPPDTYTGIEVDKTAYTKDDLEPATRYEFRVSSKNFRFRGDPTTIAVYTKPLTNPPTPKKPTMYGNETTDTTVTINLAQAIPDTDTYVESYVIEVKKVGSSSVAKREALIPRHHNESADDYIAAEIPKTTLPEKFVVGDRGTYGAYYNAPLQTGVDYRIRVGSVSRGNETEATVTFSEPTSVKAEKLATNDGPSGNPAPIIAAVAVTAIIVVALAVFVFLKRREKSQAPGNNLGLLQKKGNKDVDGAAATPNSYAETERDHGQGDAAGAGAGGTATGPKPGPAAGGPSPPEQPAAAQPSAPVRADELAEYIARKEAAGEHGFEADYKTIPSRQLHPWTVGSKPENKQKNRFANVCAYDHSRVVLTAREDDPHSDYFNACFVDGYKKKNKYIASQGANKASLNDLWRMLWQYDVDKVVMLTNPVEHGKVKCLQYWPDSGTAEYGNISVKLLSQQEFLNYTVRKIKVVQSGAEDCSRVLKQFHYTTWPDMQPPEYPAPLLDFIRVVNAHRNQGRIVVHCSAGVGRTGTYIALDSMLEQMKEEGRVDVLEFVCRMRQQRIMMVQTAAQYTFVYDALLAAHLCGHTTYAIADFVRCLTALKKKSKSSRETDLERQFKIMDELKLKNTGNSKSGQLPENVGKNRYPDFLPSDRTRPFLMTTVHKDDTNYINATFLPGYRRKCRYIGTQMPMPNTVADMWRLVYDQNCTCIVMLNAFDQDDETTCRYWPEEGCMEFGPLVVELLDTTIYEGVERRTISLSHRKKQSGPTTVSLYQHKDWPSEQEVPSSWRTMLALVQLTQDHHEEKEPIVVHCMDGLGRTAVYCTVMSLLEQFREEKVIDVFHAVLRLRAVNRNMMYSSEHYAMCYDVLRAHIDSTTVYENL